MGTRKRLHRLAVQANPKLGVAAQKREQEKRDERNARRRADYAAEKKADAERLEATRLFDAGICPSCGKPIAEHEDPA